MTEKLNKHQQARLDYFLKWFNRAQELAEEGYAILDNYGNKIKLVSWKDVDKDTDCYGHTYEISENCTCVLFENNVEYDHGLYTPIKKLKEDLSEYKFYKEVKVKI